MKMIELTEHCLGEQRNNKIMVHIDKIVYVRQMDGYSIIELGSATLMVSETLTEISTRIGGFA